MPDADAGTWYARIYATLARDHPRVWFDPTLLGWYVRLLLPADRAWPGLADLPRSIPDDVVTALVTDEVIDLVGAGPGAAGYRFHGLDNERNGRGKRGYHGGKARATSAPRDAGGRFVPDAGDPSVNAGTTLVDVAGQPLDTGRWAASEPANSNEQIGVDDDLRSSSSTPLDSTPRAGARATAPTSIDCDDYSAHTADHRWIDGIGWRCVACEASRALAEPSFREKVERAGGDAW